MRPIDPDSPQLVIRVDPDDAAAMEQLARIKTELGQVADQSNAAPRDVALSVLEHCLGSFGVIHLRRREASS